MNRSRSLLHRSKLHAFVRWAEQRGYNREPIGGAFEVARIRAHGEFPIIFYMRDRSEHVTAFGKGLKLVEEYMKEDL